MSGRYTPQIRSANRWGRPEARSGTVTVHFLKNRAAHHDPSHHRTIDDVLADYPYLERDDVLAALEYAAAAVNEREVPVARAA